MKTYQDLLALGENATDKERMEFVHDVIGDHKASRLYQDAVLGDAYDRQKNTTILNYQKVIYNLQGRAVADRWSANYHLPSNFFNRFTTQQTQFLLGNGVTWKESGTPEKLGEDFDLRLQEAGKAALVAGVSFGFYNLDHLEVFTALEFAPLYDEENGAIMAGVRFWQIDGSKPLRATFYELDGYTDYIWRDGQGAVLRDKRPYKLTIQRTDADGEIIYNGENYDGFPIVPLWGNPHHQSELTGIRAQIDAYDLIKSGFANDLDNAQIYWILHNTGGMDDVDLAEFLERIHVVGAATVDSDAGVAAEAHSIELPYSSRDALLDRLSEDLYRDYMALDTAQIAGGAATATQIRAAYEPINNKADQFEYCVLDFVRGIMALAGAEDEPTFTRSMLINVQEEVQTVLLTAEYLDEEYVTRKVMTLLGDGDKVDEVLKRKDAESIERISAAAAAETTGVIEE